MIVALSLAATALSLCCCSSALLVCSLVCSLVWCVGMLCVGAFVDRPTDRRTDGPTDGRTDGPTDGRTDGPTDGPTDARVCVGVLRVVLSGVGPRATTSRKTDGTQNHPNQPTIRPSVHPNPPKAPKALIVFYFVVVVVAKSEGYCRSESLLAIARLICRCTDSPAAYPSATWRRDTVACTLSCSSLCHSK